MRILALDPATKCGWAYLSKDGVITCGTWDLSIRRDESAGMRLIRLQSKLYCMESSGIDFLVYEAARHAGPRMQGALVVQATLQGVILSWAENRGIQYRGYSPTEIKKFATGKGNASKEQMIELAQKYDAEIVDDNVADAMHLLMFAKSEYGEASVPHKRRRRKARRR